MSLLRFPSHLLSYILQFVIPEQTHRLYRVCQRFNKICSDPKFLISKLKLEIGDDPLISEFFNLQSLAYPKANNYHRYVRVLAFYNIIVPTSDMWIGPKQSYYLSVEQDN